MKSDNYLWPGKGENEALQLSGKMNIQGAKLPVRFLHLTKNIDLSKNALFLHENPPFPGNTKTEPHPPLSK